MDFIKKNIRLIGIGGCVLGIIAVFLPFLTAKFVGISKPLFDVNSGKVVFFAFIAAGVLLYFRKSLFSLIGSGLALIFFMKEAIDAGKSVGAFVKYGVGFYFLIIALVVAIGSVIYSKFVLKSDD